MAMATATVGPSPLSGHGWVKDIHSMGMGSGGSPPEKVHKSGIEPTQGKENLIVTHSARKKIYQVAKFVDSSERGKFLYDLCRIAAVFITVSLLPSPPSPTTPSHCYLPSTLLTCS